MNKNTGVFEVSDTTKTSARSSRVKSRVITLRVSDEEYERYSKAAEWMNLSLSNFLRRALDNSEETYRSTPRVQKKRMAPEREINPELLYAIHRIGSNMNQIAKALNTANLIDEEVSSKALLLALLSIESQLEKMIEQNEAVSDEIVQKIKDELLVLLPPEKKKKEQDSNDD